MSTNSVPASTSSPIPEPGPEAPVRPPRICIPQGPHPTRAYGVIVDWECMCRWGALSYKRFYGEDPMQMPRRERDKAILRVHGTTIRVLPHRVYLAVTTLPRLERSLIYMGSSRQWLFVFRDNSSYESLHVHIDMEDVRAVKKFLGVEHERAQWYYVMVGWCVVLLTLYAFTSNLSLSCICRSIDISIREGTSAFIIWVCQSCGKLCQYRS